MSVTKNRNKLKSHSINPVTFFINYAIFYAHISFIDSHCSVVSPDVKNVISYNFVKYSTKRY